MVEMSNVEMRPLSPQGNGDAKGIYMENYRPQ